MFDRITAEELRNAPPLNGVDPERLAADLTDAYVQIATANALLRNGVAPIKPDLLAKLTSTARAQETYALILPDGEQRQAAAHVAARAYQVIALSGETTALSFTASTIPTPVSSMLLYVVADATADAEEMSQYINADELGLEGLLTHALSALGRSDLRSIVRIEMPEFTLPRYSSPHDAGAYVGYYECLRALLSTSSALLSVDRGSWAPGAFGEIAARMRGSFQVDTETGQVSADDTIAGPWHLALLLDLAERVLTSSAVTGVPVPMTVPVEAWTELVERLARRRPTLWRNHRSAVESGFLEIGTSAVVTFPTGAGKSTVAELKVAATTLAGRNAIFLVPTLSLLDQQAAALRSTLQGIEIVAPREIDDLADFEPRFGSSVFVLTPESCLALFSSAPEQFGDVGLIAFDEAHLLSASEGMPGRRSLDATLCLLLLCRKFTTADVLLVSAMIGNADSLRDWLLELTGRPAVALDFPWKPTRQARGAVVYQTEVIQRLNALISEAEQSATTDGPPAALRRAVAATPYGFFGLLTTWQSTQSEDYRWIPLLAEASPLGIAGKRSGSGWKLSSNQNHVAGAIAVSGARAGKKVLVFAQQVTWAVSTSNEINSLSDTRTSLRASERLLLSRAAEAAGSVDVLYGDFDGEGVFGDSLPHHGLLLREERRLHESLYRRPDGIRSLVATSTLAQGMNFPSEIVIIAGDRRFDADTNRMERLEAQELLNAAGRAGRAGMRSNGLVIIVPSYPVAYDGSQQMGSGWFELRQAFSQSDQCVEMVDPLTTLIALEESASTRDEIDYLTRRLARSEDEGDARDLVLQGFGAFQARRAGQLDSVKERLEALTLAMDGELPEWLRSAIASTGLAPDDLSFVGEELASSPEAVTLGEWKDWFSGLLVKRPGLLEAVLRTGSRAVFKGAPAELGAEFERLNGAGLVDAVLDFLNQWLSGANLMQMQTRGEGLRLTRSSAKCEFARKFVLRVVPDLAYLFGLPWLIAGAMGIQDEFAHTELASLALSIESGVATTSQLEFLSATPFNTRIGAHHNVQ